MKKYKAILFDFGRYDGGIDVLQDKWPDPETPRMRELLTPFIGKELEVVVRENRICFTVSTKQREGGE